MEKKDTTLEELADIINDIRQLWREAAFAPSSRRQGTSTLVEDAQLGPLIEAAEAALSIPGLVKELLPLRKTAPVKTRASIHYALQPVWFWGPVKGVWDAD
jgi:hypothetical protein